MTGAVKAFAQLAQDTGIRGVFRDHQLGLALAAQLFFAFFHGSFTGGYDHGAEGGTGAAVLAEFRSDAEGEVHVPLPAPADKADRFGLPHFRTDADATAAKDTVFVSKRIADFRNPATHGNILDSPGVWGLRDQKLGHVSS